jgi:hypothetical protein
LHVPDDDEPLDRQMHSEAAQLFVERAQATNPGVGD